MMHEISLFVKDKEEAANWLEMTGDAWKLLHVFQRPVPRGAEDIGQWWVM